MDHRRLLAASVPLNAGLIIATFISGSHYVIDTVAGLAMVAGCVAVWQVWIKHLCSPSGARSVGAPTSAHA